MAITLADIELHDRHIKACRDQEKQKLVTQFSSECDEYQKKLDQIDLWAMEIEGLIKKIRGEI